MKKMKLGTPQMGIVLGLGLVGVAVLIMLIGFWKALLLMVLFAIGYFVGTVENKQEFVKNAANRIIPAKEAKVIDIKSEISREQTEAAPAAAAEAEEAETADNNEDGE